MENNADNTIPTSEIEIEELISPNKFIVLSIATFGLYSIWWSYKTWRFFRDTEGIDVIPAGRAILNWIFFSSLLQRIKKFAQRSGHEPNYNSALLHVAYLILLFSSYLPHPYFLISLLNFLVFLEPLKALNLAKINSPNIVTNENPSFNTRQLVLVIVGSIFWILVIIGLIFGETP